MTDAGRKMDSLIRQRLGRQEPAPPEPVSANGRGDGGKTGEIDDSPVTASQQMDRLIAARLNWRRYETRGR